MFNTPWKTATHEEPWASIFRIGLTETAVRICGHLACDYDPEEFEASVFNRLTTAQKVAMLAIVGRALLDPAVPAPRLTAVVDGTVATLLDVFREELIVEADTDGYRDGMEDRSGPSITDCRAAMLRYIEPDWEEEEDGLLPDVESCNHEEWDGHAKKLYESILYDLDYADEDEYVDLPPKAAKRLKRRMGIDPEYFSIPAPDPTPAQLAEFVAILSELTGERLNSRLVKD